MKNIDLETFYSRAQISIKIAAAYIGQPAFEKIIVSCRLKPITIFTKTFKPHKIQYWWVDEFGNSLILENNKIKIIKNDLNIKHNTQISTDLFYSRSIFSTVKISKAVNIVNDCLVFYGQDEYFRCFNMSNGNKISPLEIEIDELINIQKNINPRYKLPNNEIETIIKKEFIRYE